MPIGSSKIGVLGAGLVPGGSVTFNAPGTWSIPPGVKKVSITGRGGTGNPGNSGTAGNPGNNASGGAGGSGGAASNSGPVSPPCPGFVTYSGRGGWSIKPAFYQGLNNPTPTFGPAPGPAPNNFPLWRQWGSCLKIPASPSQDNGSTINNWNAPFPFKCFWFGSAGGSGIARNGPAGAAGQAGLGGNAGSAGSAGSAGNPGNASSGLNYNFAGGGGGAAGNAGAAGVGGGGGAGGAGGGTVPSNSPNVASGASGSGGGGAGGAGDTGRVVSPTSNPSEPRRAGSSGGGGGGGAGVTNDGQNGRPWAPLSNAPLFVRSQVGFAGPISGGCQLCVPSNQTTGVKGGNFPCFTVSPPSAVNPGSGPTCNPFGQNFYVAGPANRTGGNSSASGGYMLHDGTGSWCFPYPNTGRQIYRSGAGGGAGGSVYTVNIPGPSTAYRGGGGGAGGGRGNVGNAGGAGGAGGSGQAGTPQTFNCVPVTPGGSAPVTVASPGGQITISWNPQ